MIKAVTFFSLLFLMLLSSGCDGNSRPDGDRPHSPYLMRGAPSSPVTRSPATDERGTSLSYPEDPALKIRQMELAHRERLAAIEAEKAKALKALELERLRSVEEIRRRTAEIEAQKALQLEKEKRRYAALIAEKERTIKALEANASLHRDKTTAAIARMQTESRKAVAQITGKYEQAVALLKSKLQEKTLWIAAGVILLLLLFWILFYRYRKSLEAKAREEERKHEAMMLERRLRHEEIEKVLEIIASEKTDEAVKIELARLLREGHAETETPELLPHRPSSGEKAKA